MIILSQTGGFSPPTHTDQTTHPSTHPVFINFSLSHIHVSDIWVRVSNGFFIYCDHCLVYLFRNIYTGLYYIYPSVSQLMAYCNFELCLLENPFWSLCQSIAKDFTLIGGIHNASQPLSFWSGIFYILKVSQRSDLFLWLVYCGPQTQVFTTW